MFKGGSSIYRDGIEGGVCKGNGGRGDKTQNETKYMGLTKAIAGNTSCIATTIRIGRACCVLVCLPTLLLGLLVAPSSVSSPSSPSS